MEDRPSLQDASLALSLSGKKIARRGGIGRATENLKELIQA
jgi:hypothetical protein